MPKLNDIRDLTGETFGALTVIGQSDEWYVEPGSGKRKARWLCKCECGNTVTVTAHNLGRNTTSCGCLKAKTLKRDLLSGVQAVLLSETQQYNQAQQRAERKSYPFSLTREEFAALRNSPCALCGFDEGPVSIDRIDSEQGYTVENSQPLCRVCQTLKSAFPSEFIKLHIKRIHRHLTETGEWETVLEN